MKFKLKIYGTPVETTKNGWLTIAGRRIQVMYNQCQHSRVDCEYEIYYKSWCVARGDTAQKALNTYLTRRLADVREDIRDNTKWLRESEGRGTRARKELKAATAELKRLQKLRKS